MRLGFGISGGFIGGGWCLLKSIPTTSFFFFFKKHSIIQFVALSPRRVVSTKTCLVPLSGQTNCKLSETCLKYDRSYPPILLNNFQAPPHRKIQACQKQASFMFQPTMDLLID